MTKKLLILLILILIQPKCLVAGDYPIVFDSNPTELVESLTEVLIELVRNTKLKNNDDVNFYLQLESVLRPVIHESFSRRIMGKYASNKYIVLLPKDQQKKVISQIEQFNNVLLRSLTRTYGKGLLAFDGQKIEVIELDKYRSKSTTLVKQLIYGDRKIPYTVIFALKKDDFDYWKIGNFKFENIDFGRIYKKQFNSLFQFYDEDIDLVIKNWSLSRIDTENIEKQ